MPNISEHPSTEVVKMLLVGDSGSGKTSQLASLANAGYNVRVLDFDAGLDSVRHFLTEEGASRFHYVTLRDGMETKSVDAVKRAVALLSNWKTETEDFGPVTTWTPKDVLVVDSLTFAGIAAINDVLSFKGQKLFAQPSQADWGAAARQIEWIVRFLTDDEVKCNVIFTSHINYIEDELGVKRMYPTSVGSKQPTLLGRYFNTVVRMDFKPGKDGGKRTFRTSSDHKMGLKAASNKVADEMDADLAELFKLSLGK
jgi:hypothetical protein